MPFVKYIDRFLGSVYWKCIAVMFLFTLVSILVQVRFTLVDIYTLAGAFLFKRHHGTFIRFNDAMWYAQLVIVTLTFLSVCAIIDRIFSLSLIEQYKSVMALMHRFSSGERNLRAKGTFSSQVAPLAEAFNCMAHSTEEHLAAIIESDRKRRELLANIAHDLGGPVTSIRGFAETVMLKGDLLPEAERGRLLKLVISNTQALGRMVSALFDLSKLESGSVPMERQPFSLEALACDVASRFAPLAQSREVRLDVRPQASLPLVLGDIALIERVLSNLIDNSLAFTPAGGSVLISFTEHATACEASVADTGVGIPLEHQAHVFERFYRADTSRSRDRGGTGLGLAIAKCIVEAQDGQIRLTSTPGKGTVVAFSLPAAR